MTEEELEKIRKEILNQKPVFPYEILDEDIWWVNDTNNPGYQLGYRKVLIDYKVKDREPYWEIADFGEHKDDCSLKGWPLLWTFSCGCHRNTKIRKYWQKPLGRFDKDYSAVSLTKKKKV